MKEDIPDPSPLSRGEAARLANGYILELVERLDSPDRLWRQRPVGLLCECGCFGVVESSVSGYQSAGGVWLPGHEPR